MVTPAVFKTKKVIMATLAVSFLSFIFCNSLIAFKPNGVAALPNPIMLAAILEAINPSAGLSLGTLGKRRDNIGSTNLANFRSSPDSSAIFIIPVHKTITGKIDNIKSKALLPLVKILSLITSSRPVKRENKTPITIKKNQI